LCGSIGDSTQLIDWIRDADEFGSGVKHCANTFHALQQELGQLVLRPPNAVHAGIQYVVSKCTLDAMSFVRGDDLSNERVAIRLRFDEFRQHAFRMGARRKWEAELAYRSLTRHRERQLLQL